MTGKIHKGKKDDKPTQAKKTIVSYGGISGSLNSKQPQSLFNTLYTQGAIKDTTDY